MGQTNEHSTGLTPDQKRLFRAAMIYLGYTRQSWAAEHGISVGYLDQIRGGFFDNHTVFEQIAATIARFQDAVAKEHKTLKGSKKTRAS